MKKAALTLLLFYACSPLPRGWMDITPGANLQGWTIVDVPVDGPLSPSPQWSVDTKTGIVRCSGQGGRDWLRCDKKEFGNFILHVEWRFEKIDGPAKYNSGVFVRNSAEFKIWHQAQCGSSSGGFLFGNSLVNGEIKRVDTRDQLTGANPVKPAGEWNCYEIACIDSSLSLKVNGIATSRWEHVNVLRGYVGLEAEGYAIMFKNLRIKEL